MIIITGGAGFIGRHLVKRLEDDGENVFIMDNFSRQDWWLRRLKRFDVCKWVQVLSAFDRAINIEPISEVIHLAYINGTKNFYDRPHAVMQVAIRGIDNILGACKLYSVPKFTLVSSSEVCAYAPINSQESMPLLIPDVYNPRYSYAIGKMLSEMMAVHCGLFEKLIIVRPFNIYGPGMALGHVIPDILAQFDEQKDSEIVNLELIGDGTETRSFCYIDDFIDGLMLAREKGKHRGIYNIGRAEEISIADLVQIISRVTDKHYLIAQHRKLREGDLVRRRPDISKLAALGYQPKWSLLDGLKQIMQEKEST